MRGEQKKKKLRMRAYTPRIKEAEVDDLKRERVEGG